MTTATFFCEERNETLEIFDYFDENNDKLPRRYKASRSIRVQYPDHGPSEASTQPHELSGPIRGQYPGQSEALVVQICPLPQTAGPGSVLCAGSPEADTLPLLARARVSVTQAVTMFLIEAR